jgi:serine/threonine protein kinase/Tol biopolymer transport system component
MMLGRSLLHYTVVEKLGEGGMGVVYKARDTHLDRFVALKVLPPDRVNNEERKRRFIQEAKAASALNHPNIVTIYDIATDQNTTFIAMEFVPGKTLAEAIPRQGLALAPVLHYAVQIADGLTRAHQASIIHRDLKPGNIMISDDGRVRILDFGLAKLADPSIESNDATRTLASNSAPKTHEGMVVGTAAYMSPEQAEGRTVDRRTDIFSFGVLLYEMLTGRRPFLGQSRLQTLSAIVNESPRPLSETVPPVPVELERLVDRCLRKDPNRRWQNMADVRIALLDLKEESDSGRLTASSPRIAAKPARKRWLYAAAAVIIVAAVAGWLLRSREPQQTVPDLQPIPLTAFEGDERDPAFSPDGNQIAFSWGPEGGVFNTYVKLIGPGDPIRLTNGPLVERMSQWSPDGKWIAFSREGRIVAIPALGGPERVIISPGTHPTWTPDSKYLVVPVEGSLYLAPLEGGERRLLVPPMEKDGAKYPAGADAVAPDGRTIAMNFRASGRNVGVGFDLLGSQPGPLYFISLGEGYAVRGEPRRVTPEDWNVASWSWTPDSRAVIAIRDINNANLGGDTAMYRIALAGGEPQRLAFAGDNPWYLDVARSGHRLAYTRLRVDVNLYREELDSDGTLTKSGELIGSSSRRDFQAKYAPDRSRIAFASNRSGSDEIWVADRDGRNLVQLTQSANPEGTGMPVWSPDGSRLAFTMRPAGANATDIFVIRASGGVPERLTDHPGIDLTPSWSRDGAWVYFTSNRNGQVQIWKVAATRGMATQVAAAPDGAAAVESLDGEHLYMVGRQGIRRVPKAGGNSQTLAQDPVAIGSFDVTSRGIFYLSPARDLQSAALRLLPSSGGEPKTLGTIPHRVGTGLSVASDHSSILYSQCDQCAADIMLVENFK